MKSVLKQSAVAVMMLAGVLAFTGTAAASPGSATGGTSLSTTERVQDNGSAEMSAQGSWSCPYGWLCLWNGSNATGSRYMYPEYNNNACHNLNSVSNRASSGINRADTTVLLYRGNNCRGGGFALSPGFTWNLGSFNNDISSFMYYHR